MAAEALRRPSTHAPAPGNFGGRASLPGNSELRRRAEITARVTIAVRSNSPPSKMNTISNSPIPITACLLRDMIDDPHLARQIFA